MDHSPDDTSGCRIASLNGDKCGCGVFSLTSRRTRRWTLIGRVELPKQLCATTTSSGEFSHSKTQTTHSNLTSKISMSAQFWTIGAWEWALMNYELVNSPDDTSGGWVASLNEDKCGCGVFSLTSRRTRAWTLIGRVVLPKQLCAMTTSSGEFSHSSAKRRFCLIFVYLYFDCFFW